MGVRWEHAGAVPETTVSPLEIDALVVILGVLKRTDLTYF